MKRRTLLRLIVSLLLIAAFVVGATVLESNNSSDPQAWYWAQRQLPLLWVVDAFALLALVPVCGFASAQNRLYRRAEDTARTRDEHQSQLERMILNAERADQQNAGQADTIEALQETIALLTTRLEAVIGETQARQQALEAEARHLAEQAFAALNGQVEANTRQMEAVNLAMQYQRAEIKQLRQGVRVIERHHELFHVARLSPAEQAALESATEPEPAGYLTSGDAGFPGVEPDNTLPGHDDRESAPESALAPDTRSAQADNDSVEESRQITAGAGEPGFFAPTMNGQATFVSPPAAYTIAPPAPPSFEEPELRLDEAGAAESGDARGREAAPSGQEAEPHTAYNLRLSTVGDSGTPQTCAENDDRNGEKGAASSDFCVTEEEYSWLTATATTRQTDNLPPESPPEVPRRLFKQRRAEEQQAKKEQAEAEQAETEQANAVQTKEEQADAVRAKEEPTEPPAPGPNAPSPASRRWKLRF